MDKEIVKAVVFELEEQKRALYMAERVIDKRRRQKQILDVKRSIVDYVHSLPDEVKAYLDLTVAPNALHFQWVEGDLDRCISSLRESSDSLSDG